MRWQFATGGWATNQFVEQNVKVLGGLLAMSRKISDFTLADARSVPADISSAGGPYCPDCRLAFQLGIRPMVCASAHTLSGTLRIDFRFSFQI